MIEFSCAYSNLKFALHAGLTKVILGLDFVKPFAVMSWLQRRGRREKIRKEGKETKI